jgi:hypothetical protein
LLIDGIHDSGFDDAVKRIRVIWLALIASQQ